MTSKGISARHPLRILERAIGGGLGRGNIGVVLSRHGVGKTGFLIGVAIDALLQGRKVLHISTQESVEHTRNFYDQLFHNLADDMEFPNRAQLHLDMERNRHILVYNRKLFSLEKLKQSVGFLRDSAHFEPSLVIMDGTPRYEKTEQWEMDGLRELAQHWNAEIWTASQTHREDQQCDARGVPREVARFEDSLAVILSLESTADHVRLRILKDHGRRDIADLHMELDPGTLLLRWR